MRPFSKIAIKLAVVSLVLFPVTPVVIHAASAPSITPKAVYVHLGQAQVFVVSPTATTWTATSGEISRSGVFAAPSTPPVGGKATIVASGPNGSASAVVTFVSGPFQSATPSTLALALGVQQQLVSADARSWTAAYGAVSSSGLYTAPKVWPAAGSDTVIVNGLHGTATVHVTLIPPVPAISKAGNNGEFPLGSFSVPVIGSGFTTGSTATLNGTPLSTSYSAGALTVSGFALKPGPATLVVTNINKSSQPFPVQVGVRNALASPSAARRLLQQAAFGPSPRDADHIQAIGIPAWIQEQFRSTSVSNFSAVKAQWNGMPEQFLVNAVNNPDQLRQRVAFALSQIFVTSLAKLSSNPNMISYQNMLLAKSFTNYRDIMQSVTLSTAMGLYLDTANNAKADPTTGSEANQNYARELMQLFTLGTNQLNQDGTPILDSNGLPIPTYTQDQIAELSRVFTGWTFAPKPGTQVKWGGPIGTYGDLVPYPSQHDSGSKQLLNGYVAPAGLSPADDLSQALDNVFNHPNAGPFVGRLLIQHLVKSNPSPAYVSRVAAAFNDNGSGVRGDMKAIITAILLDPEARANDEGQMDLATDGHMQEPALYIAGMIRAFGGSINTSNYYWWDLIKTGENIYSSPSVFNYYSPDYQIQNTSLSAGEMQIHTPYSAIVRANLVSRLFRSWSLPVQHDGPGVAVDLSGYLPLANNPSDLVDALDLTLTHGTMPTAMKEIIVNAVAAEAGGPLRRTQRGCYLILTSSYYNVWH